MLSERWRRRLGAACGFGGVGAVGLMVPLAVFSPPLSEGFPWYIVGGWIGWGVLVSLVLGGMFVYIGESPEPEAAGCRCRCRCRFREDD